MLQTTDFRTLRELRAAKRAVRQQLISSSKTVYKDVFFGTVPALKNSVKTQGKAQKLLSYGFLAWRGFKITKNVFKFISLFKNKKTSKKGTKKQ
ncbi:MAG: hypothetical protein IKH26_14010 [Bacteroidaceae bacterium]|nr:hypothetical protein [Bacteroidaceae bacterium]